MTATNPHPLANPYNTRRFGNFNIDKALYGGYINKTSNPSQLTVPQSKYSYEDALNYQKQLTPPNQLDIPLKHQNIGYNKDWERTENITDILNNLNSNSAHHANEESKRLEDNMTDSQKELLDQLNSGKLMKLSKLELEQ